MSSQPEHFDVLIIGAGLSGVGAGYHLQTSCPTKRYAILEGREAIGGTWHLFRFPGLRSDSDMFTLGYPFRPWKEAKAIADGASILKYVEDTAREFGIDRHIRFRHRVRTANWSCAESKWIVDVEIGEERKPARYTCNFLYACAGYYDYERGYTPAFPGVERFAGEIVHPQKWPDALDLRGKKVVVIGSGATAVTLVPALAKDAAHVTMLQRSPTYITTLPSRDPIADLARRVLPQGAAHRLVRTKNVLLGMTFYQLARRAPSLTKRLIRAGVVKALPTGYDVDTHFKPRYEPWDQRVCFVPDSDLFRVITEGRASIVTDRIASFTETGLTLESGKTLEADVVVTATGLNLLAIGGIKLALDGARLEIPETYTYKGLMLGNVPNFAFCVGYTNASWTLRADLSSTFVCRVLNAMDRKGAKVCTPRLDDARMKPQPILDLTSGYVQRAVASFPKQGSVAPWFLRQNYLLDLLAMKYAKLDDGVLSFRPSA